MFTFITGAASSKKSEYGEALAGACGCSKKIYLATMENKDYNLSRIEKHRKMRQNKGFETIECPVDIIKASALIKKDSVVLLEDLPNLLANELFGEGALKSGDAPLVIERIIKGILELEKSSKQLILITGELLSSGSNYDQSTLNYLKNLGLINRILAKKADCFIEIFAGRPFFVCKKEK
ncbi:MAG: bifunctional adenosylcobinamide kinase/adenosylcobinamide-phosphate guanylyltransferase [Lachnospiraceae bacterium]|nr:bifunctional adenosylcobinamide kinase/adenosylcobinamide-phosphate guanylyltransferase [Lachnospiraceae bacterium]